MPLTLSAALTSHLGGELLTLATLWEVIRTDGVTYYYTDHDTDLVFNGNTYVTGIGYDRTALDDKGDLSVDNLDISGILDTDQISREDIRAGLFDGAEVWIRVVNWKDPTTDYSLIRRRGWLGEVKQNNLGQFSTELRGLSQALSETLSSPYTPGCPVDLGSTGIRACNRSLSPSERQESTYYEVGEEMTISELPDRVFRASVAGVTNSDTDHDFYDFDIDVGSSIADGEVTWVAYEPWFKTGTVQVSPAPDRRTFTINISESRLDSDPRWYDGGLLRFDTGDNAGISREIKIFDMDSAGDGIVTLYLRMPFNINAGDTCTLWPGCDKSTTTCKNRFDNIINYQGFPYVPGDNYLKDYPDSKL